MLPELAPHGALTDEDNQVSPVLSARKSAGNRQFTKAALRGIIGCVAARISIFGAHAASRLKNSFCSARPDGDRARRAAALCQGCE